MTPDQARLKVDKLRAHASSVDGTPEADLFYAKANELAREHGLSLTPHGQSTASPPRARADRPSGAAHPQPAASTRKDTTMNSTTKPNANRRASDGTIRNAFTPRTRAAFGRTTEPGTEVTGTIVAMEEEPDLDFHTKAPKFNPDGTERMIPVLILQTDGTTKPYGSGLRKMWVRSGIADALIGACLESGAARPAIGGKVRIRYEGHGEPPAPNFAAPKIYQATYEPPIDQEAC